MESVVKVGDYGTAGGSVMESAVKTAQDRQHHHLSNLLLSDYQQLFYIYLFWKLSSDESASGGVLDGD